MSSKPASCTLSITSARPDAPYLAEIVRHLVKACNYPFVERVLVMDTAPLSPRYQADPDIVTQDKFFDIGRQLINEGVIDRIAHPDYSSAARKATYTKHFGSDHWATHDFRGTQVLGTMQQIDEGKGDYFLHFDSDILLYQSPGHSWIAAGIALLRDLPEVMVALPRPGPPPSDGTLHQAFATHIHDPRGFFAFKLITSRRFLIDRRKFDQILPMKPIFVSRKRKLLSHLTRRSALHNWEQSTTSAIEKTAFIRADLDSPDAWTLHAADHGPKFRRAVSAIIALVERGWFPPEQAGKYDLELDRYVAEIGATGEGSK